MAHGVLAGQRAIVIGGGSGFGFGSDRFLPEDGTLVSLAGRTVDKLEAAHDTLDGRSVRTAVEASSDSEGRLHIAVAIP